MGFSGWSVQIAISMPPTGNIQTFTAINLAKGTYNPDIHSMGTFQVFKVKKAAGKRSKKMVSHKDFIGKFSFHERELSVEEQKLVPKIEDWYVVPDEEKILKKYRFLYLFGGVKSLFPICIVLFVTSLL